MAKKLILTVAGTVAIDAAVLSTAHRVLTAATAHGIPNAVNEALVFKVEGEKVKVYGSKDGETVTIAFTGQAIEPPKNLPLELGES